MTPDEVTATLVERFDLTPARMRALHQTASPDLQRVLDEAAPLRRATICAYLLQGATPDRRLEIEAHALAFEHGFTLDFLEAFEAEMEPEDRAVLDVLPPLDRIALLIELAEALPADMLAEMRRGWEAIGPEGRQQVITRYERTNVLRTHQARQRLRRLRGTHLRLVHSRQRSSRAPHRQATATPTARSDPDAPGDPDPDSEPSGTHGERSA